MKVYKDYSLKNYNTFGVDVKARYFTVAGSTEELQEILLHEPVLNQKRLILGGGSNVLFTKDFGGMVIHIDIQGIKEETEGDDVIMEVGAGMIWDDFVKYCIDKELWGVENLIAIPGRVGAAPIQNIGAYGMEQEMAFESCGVMMLKNPGSVYEFRHPDCMFGYRSSVFKKLKEGFVITSVKYRLSKKPKRVLSYQGLNDKFEEQGLKAPTSKQIAQAVSDIRASKLPDPEITGNAGSFFKNPMVSAGEMSKIRDHYPGLVYYKSGEKYKIPAGWLIEQAGWKGKRAGDAGVHENQALVLVNHGNASGKQILELARKISDSVYEKFGISLYPEVNII